MLRNEGFEGAKRADTVLKRQGALLGAGLLDAGGRNTVLQLMGVGGLRREAAVSVFLGCQVWEWYPLVQIMVKALVPTMVIGVDSSLHMPKDFQLRCDQPESRFGTWLPYTCAEDFSSVVSQLFCCCHYLFFCFCAARSCYD